MDIAKFDEKTGLYLIGCQYYNKSLVSKVVEEKKKERNYIMPVSHEPVCDGYIGPGIKCGKDAPIYGINRYEMQYPWHDICKYCWGCFKDYPGCQNFCTPTAYCFIEGFGLADDRALIQRILHLDENTLLFEWYM